MKTAMIGCGRGSKMEEGNKKVAVAGHISLDITPVFQNSGKQKLSELFQPGKAA